MGRGKRASTSTDEAARAERRGTPYRHHGAGEDKTQAREEEPEQGQERAGDAGEEASRERVPTSGLGRRSRGALAPLLRPQLEVRALHGLVAHGEMGAREGLGAGSPGAGEADVARRREGGRPVGGTGLGGEDRSPPRPPEPRLAPVAPLPTEPRFK